jgi:hypothetical protein
MAIEFKIALEFDWLRQRLNLYDEHGGKYDCA